MLVCCTSNPPQSPWLWDRINGRAAHQRLGGLLARSLWEVKTGGRRTVVNENQGKYNMPGDDQNTELTSSSPHDYRRVS